MKYFQIKTGMAGVALISFNGSGIERNPAGDVLAVPAAFVRACDSILTRKISSCGAFPF